ncbi:NAD(P)H-hydrate epimerase [Planctomycetota bacterium]
MPDEAITRAQAREADRHAIEDLHIPSICLMENAGRQVADAACDMVLGRGRVLVVCGSGNNGGDGFVAARHLLLRGVESAVLLLGSEEKLTPDSKVNYEAARACKIPISICEDIREAGLESIARRFVLIIDALLGTGVRGEVRDPYASAIRAIQATRLPILSADIPSGLDCDTGRVLGVCVKAAKTVTFIQRKVGFEKVDGPEMCGEIIVADIGAPV